MLYEIFNLLCFICFLLLRSRGGISVFFLSFVVWEKGERGEWWNIFKWVIVFECEVCFGRRIFVKNFNFIMLIKIFLNFLGCVLVVIWVVFLNCIFVYLFLLIKSVFINKLYWVINSFFFLLLVEFNIWNDNEMLV